MLVASQVDNVVVLILDAPTKLFSVETIKATTRIYSENKTLGYNFHETILGDPGILDLESRDLDVLNEKISRSGFKDIIELDRTPRFVVAYVSGVEDLEGSDHLKKVNLKVGEDKFIQVISGSPNMQPDIYVVAVLPGAVMPNGQVIYPSEFKGVKSEGMIASGRELHIHNAPNKPGAMILPSNWKQNLGEELNWEEAQTIYE
jgi:tRNA-binding protein